MIDWLNNIYGYTAEDDWLIKNRDRFKGTKAQFELPFVTSRTASDCINHSEPDFKQRERFGHQNRRQIRKNSNSE